MNLPVTFSDREWKRRISSDISSLGRFGVQGGVSRRVQDKLAETVSVSDYGAKGDGATDDTAAIQAAIDSLAARGGTILFPRGEYICSVTVSGSSIRLQGDGREATKLTAPSSSATVITVTGDYFSLDGIGIGYVAAATAGAGILFDGASYSTVTNLSVGKAFEGVKYTNAANTHSATGVLLTQCVLSGLVLDGCANVSWSKFLILAGSIAESTLGAIRLRNGIEGCNLSDGQTYRGLYSLHIDAASYVPRHRPAGCAFNGIFFDSAKLGAVVFKAVDIDFTACWFGYAGDNDGGIPVASTGLYLDQVDDIRFNGGRAVSNFANGVVVSANAKRVRFNNFTARENSLIAANTYCGLTFEAGCSDFSVTQCSLGSAATLFATATQKYGVFVAAGASDRYIIADNLVSGNGTAGVSDGGSGANKRVANNY